METDKQTDRQREDRQTGLAASLILSTNENQRRTIPLTWTNLRNYAKEIEIKLSPAQDCLYDLYVLVSQALCISKVPGRVTQISNIRRSKHNLNIVP